jgi:hypothetical protein
MKMNNLFRKGVVIILISLFFGANTILAMNFNQTNDKICYNQKTFSEVILNTSFEEEWILDSNGDYYAPPNWNIDGICNSRQYGFLECYTHYWSDMHKDESGFILTHFGNVAACVWWSDGYGESEEVGMNQDEWLISPELDFSYYSSINLSFWSIYYWNPGLNNSDYVKISTDKGDTWEVLTDLAHDPQWRLGGSEPDWENWNHYEYPVILDLSEYVGESSVMLAFHYYCNSTGGRGIWVVDEVTIEGIPDIISPEVFIDQPKVSTIYLRGQEFFTFQRIDIIPIIIGELNISVSASDNTEIKQVEIFVNNVSKAVFKDEPYIWKWDETGFGKHIIKAEVSDLAGNSDVFDITVLKLL